MQFEKEVIASDFEKVNAGIKYAGNSTLRQELYKYSTSCTHFLL